MVVVISWTDRSWNCTIPFLLMIFFKCWFELSLFDAGLCSTRPGKIKLISYLNRPVLSSGMKVSNKTDLPLTAHQHRYESYINLTQQSAPSGDLDRGIPVSHTLSWPIMSGLFFFKRAGPGGSVEVLVGMAEWNWKYLFENNPGKQINTYSHRAPGKKNDSNLRH